MKARLSVSTFYRLALALPLVLPLMGALTAITARYGIGPEWLFGSWSILSVSLLLYAGAEYLAFAVIALVWSRGRTTSELRRAALFAPLVFAPLAALSILVRNAAYGSTSFRYLLVAPLSAGAAAIAVGYLFVGLTLGLAAVGERTGLLRR